MTDFSLWALLALIFLIAAGSLLHLWITSGKARSEDTSRHRSAVIIVSDDRFRADGFRLLERVLDKQGFASSWVYVDNYPGTGLFLNELSQMKEQTEITAVDVWLIFDHAPDSEVLQLAAGTDYAGIIVAASDNLGWTTANQTVFLPQGMPFALFYGLNDPRARPDEAREFFEWQTGEDASLYKGDTVKWSSSETYRSLDGSIVLSIYPGMAESYAFISPFLITDIALTLTSWQFPDAEDLESRPSMLSYLLPYYIRFLLTIFMIVCISPLLIINLRRKIPDRRIRVNSLLLTRVLYWLPAIAISAAIAIVFAVVSGRTELLLLTFFIFLPGADGWTRLFAGRKKLARQGNEKKIRPGKESPAESYYSMRRQVLLIPLITVSAALILFWIWRYLAFGWNTPALLPVQIFPVLLVFNAACGYDEIDMTGAFNLRLTLARQWPFLALIIASLALMRGDMILSAFLLAVISFWSVNAGKAVAIAARSPLAGSITCSLYMISAWMIPPVLQGLAVY